MNSALNVLFADIRIKRKVSTHFSLFLIKIKDAVLYLNFHVEHLTIFFIRLLQLYIVFMHMYVYSITSFIKIKKKIDFIVVFLRGIDSHLFWKVVCSSFTPPSDENIFICVYNWCYKISSLDVCFCSVALSTNGSTKPRTLFKPSTFRIS